MFGRRKSTPENEAPLSTGAEVVEKQILPESTEYEMRAKAHFQSFLPIWHDLESGLEQINFGYDVYFQQLGVPTDETGFPQHITTELLQQRIAEKNQKLEEYRAGLANDPRMKSMHIEFLPFFMLPSALWQSELSGTLLEKLNLYPSDLSNMFMMPANTQSSMAFGLPEFPKGMPEGYMQTTGNFVALVIQVYTRYMQGLQNEVAQGNDQNLDNIYKAALLTRIRIQHIAHESIKLLFGEEAYNEHARKLGPGLGWPAA